MFNSLLFVGWMLVALGAVVLVYRLFGKAGLFGVIAASVVLMNVMVTKSVIIFGIGATGGNVLYSAIYFSTDILSEKHGKREARKGVFIGFAAAVMGLAVSLVTIWMRPAEWDFAHDALVTVLSPMFRIVVGSMVAYLISQTLDTYTYQLLKERFPKHLWLRNNGSTISSQLVDSLIFCTIALLGTMPSSAWLQVVISTFVVKVIIAAVDTPFLYLASAIQEGKPLIKHKNTT